MAYKYDIFISKNSLDQELADALVSFLEANGLRTFESKKDLPELKKADYHRAIFDALDRSASVIIICSVNENGSTSKWVREEWSWFLNEVLSGRRDGEVMTIRKDIDIREIDSPLRKYESFEYEKDFERLLKYVRPSDNDVPRKEHINCELHFETNAPCDIFLYDKFIGHLKANGDLSCPLPPGTYKFRFEATSFSGEVIEKQYTSGEKAMDLIQIRFKERSVKRKKTKSSSALARFYDRLLLAFDDFDPFKSDDSDKDRNVPEEESGKHPIKDAIAGLGRGLAWTNPIGIGILAYKAFSSPGERREDFTIEEGTSSVTLYRVGGDRYNVGAVMNNYFGLSREYVDSVLNKVPVELFTEVSPKTAILATGALLEAGAIVWWNPYGSYPEESMSGSPDKDQTVVLTNAGKHFDAVFRVLREWTTYDTEDLEALMKLSPVSLGVFPQGDATLLVDKLLSVGAEASVYWTPVFPLTTL